MASMAAPSALFIALVPVSGWAALYHRKRRTL